jgi:hypothetical protein
MRTTKTVEFPIYSSSYLVSFDGGGFPSKRPGLPWRLLRYLLKIPGRLWRLICFKIIMITVLALICGFFFGSLWTILELDSPDEYTSSELEYEWVLPEAEI